MSECPNLGGCPFFNDRMNNMPSMSAVYKRNYCKSDFDSCARYMIATKLGKEKVPPNLYPNMKDEALRIISEG